MTRSVWLGYIVHTGKPSHGKRRTSDINNQLIYMYVEPLQKVFFRLVRARSFSLSLALWRSDTSTRSRTAKLVSLCMCVSMFAVRI